MKSKYIQVRVTPSELEKVKELARLAQISVSEWLRNQINSAKRIDKQ